MAQMTKLGYHRALRGADLTPTEYMVLMTLAVYTDGQMRGAHPGWTRLAADTHLDKRTIKKAVNSLTEKGYLVLAVPGGNQHRKGQANEYDLVLPEGRGVPSDPLVDRRGTPSAPLEGREGVHPVHPRGTSGAHEGVHPVTPHQVLASSPSSAAAAEPLDLLTSSGLDPEDHDAFRKHISAKHDGLIIHLHKTGQLTSRVAEFKKQQGQQATARNSWDLPLLGSVEWNAEHAPCNVCGVGKGGHADDCVVEERQCPECGYLIRPPDQQPASLIGEHHAPDCGVLKYRIAEFRRLNPWMSN